MKKACLFLLISLAACAQASYELLLVADNGNGSAGTSRVHRIDGATGTYLGSFGAGVLNGAKGITINPNTGIAYVHETNGGYQMFNAYSGLYLGQLDSHGGFDRYPVLLGSSMYATGFGVVRTILSTGANSSLTMQGADYSLWLAQYKTTTALVCGLTNSSTVNLYSFDPSTGFTTLASNIMSPYDSYFTGAAVVSRYQNGNDAVLAGRGDLGDLRIVKLTGSGGYASQSTLDLASLNKCYGVASAHNGVWVTGKLASDATHGGVTMVNNFGSERQTYSYANMYDPRGIATVVAPEPGTLAALGLGMAALARRRRKGR